MTPSSRSARGRTGGPERRLADVALALAVWTYASAVLAVVLLMWPLGDRFWLSTLVLLGPRWVVSLPLLALIPASLVLGRRWLVLLIPCASHHGLSRALALLASRASGKDSLRVLTLNLGGFSRDPAQLQALRQLMDESRPDVAVFQECQASMLLGLGSLLDSTSASCPAGVGFPIFGSVFVASVPPFKSAIFTSAGPFTNSLFWDNITASPVPEPGTLLLLGPALLAAGAWRRRKAQ